MNAKEAREKAHSINVSETNSQYVKAQKGIAEAVASGKYEYWFYEALRSDVQNKLESEGFTIGPPQSDRDGVLIKISWTK